MAEAYFVPLAPHCGSTLLGMTASLHATAAIPLFLIHEGAKGHDPFGVVQKWNSIMVKPPALRVAPCQAGVATILPPGNRSWAKRRPGPRQRGRFRRLD